MNNFNVGEACHIVEASPYSVSQYNIFKRQVQGLVCACSISTYEKLTILEVLTPKLIMVQSQDNPLKIALVGPSDIEKID